MALSKAKKAEIVKKFAKSEKDTVSVEFQVSLITEKIKSLTAHLKANDKDNTARRGLFVLVGQRKSLLAYLERTDRDAYAKLIAELGLRK